jgi:hypothetical protein
MSHWPKQLAELLAQEFGYRSELMEVETGEVTGYFQEKLKKIHFGDFIRGLG